MKKIILFQLLMLTANMIFSQDSTMVRDSMNRNMNNNSNMNNPNKKLTDSSNKMNYNSNMNNMNNSNISVNKDNNSNMNNNNPSGSLQLNSNMHSGLNLGKEGWAALPVIETEVSTAVVSNLKAKFSDNLYDILKMKSVNNTDVYMVRVWNNGSFRSDIVGEDGNPVSLTPIADNTTKTTTTTTAPVTHMYYYYPTSNVYYDDATQTYWYWENNSSSWSMTQTLPTTITIGQTQRYPITYTGADPWKNNATDKIKYKSKNGKEKTKFGEMKIKSKG